LAGSAARIAHSLGAGGGVVSSSASLPAPLRAELGHAARLGFATGLNDILLVGGIIALVAAVLSFALIRQRDFVIHPDDVRADAMPAEPELVMRAG
jgi:hypothetical protein